MDQMNEQAKQKMIEEFIAGKRLQNYSQEILELLKKDLEFGLTKEQVQMYLKKQWNVEHMKVYSSCLRQGFPQNAIDVITQENLSPERMKVALEFYEKAVPLDTVQSVINENDTAKKMQDAFNAFIQNLKNISENPDKVPPYAADLLEQIKAVVEKIQFQEQRYDEMNQKLTIFAQGKAEEEEHQKLIDKLEDKDKLLDSQQNEINQGHTRLARMEAEMKKKDKEMEEMAAKMGEMEKSMKEKDQQIHDLQAEAKQQNCNAGKMETAVDAPVQETERGSNQVRGGPYVMPVKGGSIPVYYTVPMIKQGVVVGHAPVEHTQRKSLGMAALFGKMCFKKKSRQDIVSLVVNGNLVPAQLVQIKSGMEKGLTERQLEELINNNVSAEKMKEIIEIAVLENSMAF